MRPQGWVTGRQLVSDETVDVLRYCLVPGQVAAVDLHMPAGDVVTATVTLYLTRGQAERLAQSLIGSDSDAEPTTETPTDQEISNHE